MRLCAALALLLGVSLISVAASAQQATLTVTVVPTPAPPSSGGGGGGPGCADADQRIANGVPASWICGPGSFDFDKMGSLPNYLGYWSNVVQGGNCTFNILLPALDSEGIHTGFKATSGTPPNATFNVYGAGLYGSVGIVGDFYIEYNRRVLPAGEAWKWGDTDFWVNVKVGPYGGIASTVLGMNFPEFGWINYNYFQGDKGNETQFPGSTANLGPDYMPKIYDGGFHSVGLKRIGATWTWYIDGVQFYSMSKPYPPGNYDYPFDLSTAKLDIWANGVGSNQCPPANIDSTFRYIHTLQPPT